MNIAARADEWITRKMTPEERLVRLARINICEGCSLYIRFTKTCTPWPIGCGCFIPAKAAGMKGSCPKGKWQAMTKQDVIEFTNNLIESVEVE